MTGLPLAIACVGLILIAIAAIWFLLALRDRPKVDATTAPVSHRLTSATRAKLLATGIAEATPWTRWRR